MNALNENGCAVLAGLLALCAMCACFILGIPGLGVALVGFPLACFALEYTFSTARGFLVTVTLAAVFFLWSILAVVGLSLGALHWM